MCPFRRLHIDLKAHPAIVQDEIDDPAHSCKTGGISHGQNTGPPQTAEDLARRVGTISYEIVCGISKRVPRAYHRDGEAV